MTFSQNIFEKLNTDKMIEQIVPSTTPISRCGEFINR